MFQLMACQEVIKMERAYFFHVGRGQLTKGEIKTLQFAQGQVLQISNLEARK